MQDSKKETEYYRKLEIPTTNDIITTNEDDLELSSLQFPTATPSKTYVARKITAETPQDHSNTSNRLLQTNLKDLHVKPTPTKRSSHLNLSQDMNVAKKPTSSAGLQPKSALTVPRY